MNISSMFNFHQLLANPFSSILLSLLYLIPYYFKVKPRYYIFSSVDISIRHIGKIRSLKKLNYHTSRLPKN